MSDWPRNDFLDDLPMDSESKDSYLLRRYQRPAELTILSEETGDRRSQVLVGGPDCDFDSYCLGFLRAANAVVEHVVRKRLEGKHTDFSVFWESPAYAALFLYRHYLELRLKELIVGYGGALPDQEHSLIRLWTRLMSLAKEELTEVPEESQKDLGMAEVIVTRFGQLDKNSQVFRYPVSRDKKPSLKHAYVNIVELKDALGWLSQFLEGWSVGVYERRHRPPQE